MSASLERAQLLFAHERYDQAERELRVCLAADPQQVGAHYLLALCLSKQDRYEEATDEARTAISLSPDESLTHYGLAKVLYAQDLYDDAWVAIDEAIRLDPNDAYCRALSAAIHHDTGRWEEAVAETEMGLEVNPRHTGCLNIRALALVNLGRRKEAAESLAISLEIDPESAVTHAGRGWALLNARRPDEAIVHFREALRLDPLSVLAREGLVDAVKARSFLYRWILAYLLWAGRTKSHVRSCVFGNPYLVCIFGLAAALIFPMVRFLILFALGSYIAFMIMTWLADPLFNLVIQFDPVARHVLNRDQVMATRCVIACLLIGIPMVVIGILLELAWLGIAGFTFAALSLPVAATFACDRGHTRTTMTGITLAIAAGGLVVAYISIRSEAKAIGLIKLIVAGVVASLVIANSLRNGRQTNRK